MTKTVKEAAYVAVGFGVLGFQQAQVRRRALAQQLQDQRPEVESQLAETRGQLAELARQVEQRLEPVMVDLSQRAEPVLDEIESRLPEQARGCGLRCARQPRTPRNSFGCDATNQAPLTSTTSPGRPGSPYRPDCRGLAGVSDRLEHRPQALLQRHGRDPARSSLET